METNRTGGIKMAFITDILNTIKNARKGKDMRQAIYDGIKQCYDDATGHPESVAATVKEIGEVSANLLKETADRKTEVNTERKRIDNLIATGTAQTQEIGKTIIQDSSISSSGIVLKGLTNNNYYYKLFEESRSIDSEFCTITNQQGKYTAKLLKPGLYYMNFKVHVEMSGGFSEEVIAPLKLFKSNTLDFAAFDVLDAETVEISKIENTSINKKIHFIFKITEPSYIRIYIDIDTSHTKSITFRIDGCDITVLDWKGKQSADLSELHDLRIGADSTVYDTAGEAVRKQIGNLKDDLEDIARGNQPFAIVKDEYVNINGEIRKTDQKWDRTDYIEINNNLVIISKSSSVFNCFFDSTKSFVSNFPLSNGENKFIVPDNAKYIICSNTSDAIKELIVKSDNGTRITDLENDTEAHRIALKSSKNLIGTIPNKFYPIDYKANENITFSTKGLVPVTKSHIFYFYDENKKYVTDYALYPPIAKRTVSFDKDAKYISLKIEQEYPIQVE